MADFQPPYPPQELVSFNDYAIQGDDSGRIGIFNPSGTEIWYIDANGDVTITGSLGVFSLAQFDDGILSISDITIVDNLNVGGFMGVGSSKQGAGSPTLFGGTSVVNGGSTSGGISIAGRPRIGDWGQWLTIGEPNGTNDGYILQIKGGGSGSGYGILTGTSASITATPTIRNTLDDGLGNMNIAGSLTASNLATFNSGITGSGNTGALHAGSGILGTANLWTAAQAIGGNGTPLLNANIGLYGYSFSGNVLGANISFMSLWNNVDNVGGFIGENYSSVQIGMFNRTSSLQGVLNGDSWSPFLVVTDTGSVYTSSYVEAGIDTSNSINGSPRNVLDDGNGDMSVAGNMAVGGQMSVTGNFDSGHQIETSIQTTQPFSATVWTGFAQLSAGDGIDWLNATGRTCFAFVLWGSTTATLTTTGTVPIRFEISASTGQLYFLVMAPGAEITNPSFIGYGVYWLAL